MADILGINTEKGFHEKVPFASKILLESDSTENNFISIAECGIYVIDLVDVSDDNLRCTCVIWVTDLTKTAYSTVTRNLSKETTPNCQVVMYPQSTDGGGYGVLQVVHNSNYEWQYQIANVARIACLKGE